MALQKDLRAFIELLNSNKVEYLIVGAFALAYHGWPRYTRDLDILVRPEEENAARIETALRDFGFGSAGLSAEDFKRRYQAIQLGFEPNRIDLLTTLTGVTFEEAWEQRVPAVLDGVPVWFISREHLVRNKRAAGRPQDLADVARIESQVETGE